METLHFKFNPPKDRLSRTIMQNIINNLPVGPIEYEFAKQNK